MKTVEVSKLTESRLRILVTTLTLKILNKHYSEEKDPKKLLSIVLFLLTEIKRINSLTEVVT